MIRVSNGFPPLAGCVRITQAMPIRKSVSLVIFWISTFTSLFMTACLDIIIVSFETDHFPEIRGFDAVVILYAPCKPIEPVFLKTFL